MKKIFPILLAAAVCAPVFVHAQTPVVPPKDTGLFIKKGDVMIGANLLGASFAVGQGTGYYNIGLAPRLGYFISDRVVLGTYVSAGFAGSGTYSAQNFGLGVFTRYYLNKAHNRDGEVRRMRFFAEGGAGAQYGRARYQDGSGGLQRESGTATDAYLLTGFNYFLNKNVAVEGALQYSRRIGSSHGSRYSEGMKINVGLQIFLGR
jgi:hypothetical protein